MFRVGSGRFPYRSNGRKVALRTNRRWWRRRAAGIQAEAAREYGVGRWEECTQGSNHGTSGGLRMQ